MAENLSRKRAAATNTVFAALQTVVAIVNGMVLVPVYLQHLSPAEYGAWLATGNVLAWLTIVDPGVGDLARQRVAMFYGARRWSDACSVIWTGGLVVAGIAGGIVLLAEVLAPSMVAILDLHDPAIRLAAQKTFTIAGLATGLLFFGAFVCGVIQSLQRTFGIGIVVLVGSLVLPIVRLVLLQMGMGIEGLAWGMVAQGLFITIASLALLAWRVAAIGEGFCFGTSQLRSIIGLSAFTSLQRVASVAGTNLRGIFVTRYLGPETTVVFEMTRAPLDYARTFLDKPISSFTPAFAHLKGEGDSTKITSYAFRFASVFISLLALCVAGYVSLNGAFVRLWLGNEFFLGAGLNSLLAVSFAIAVVINAARGFLYAMGEIKRVSVAIVLLSAATVAAQYVGLHFHGLTGLIVLPLVVNMVFCLVGFPKSVAATFLGASRSSTLLWNVVVPAGVAALLAGMAGTALLNGIPDTGWATLVAAVIMEGLVFALVLLGTSAVLRQEAAHLVAGASIRLSDVRGRASDPRRQS